MAGNRMGGIESATKRVTAVLIKNWFLIKLQNITVNRINFNTLGTESKLTTRTKREQHKTQDKTFSPRSPSLLSCYQNLNVLCMILCSDASCFIVKNRKS